MTIPVSSMLLAPFVPLQLSAEEKKYVQRLISLPLDSIIDYGVGEKRCEDIGQEIFDKAKAAYNRDTFSAKNALTRICNAVGCNQSESQKDAILRKKYIHHAWTGIGDDNWHWNWQVTTWLS